jgi:hypothetical protein
MIILIVDGHITIDETFIAAGRPDLLYQQTFIKPDIKLVPVIE